MVESGFLSYDDRATRLSSDELRVNCELKNIQIFHFLKPILTTVATLHFNKCEVYAEMMLSYVIISLAAYESDPKETTFDFVSEHWETIQNQDGTQSLKIGARC